MSSKRIVNNTQLMSIEMISENEIFQTTAISDLTHTPITLNFDICLFDLLHQLHGINYGIDMEQCIVSKCLDFDIILKVRYSISLRIVYAYMLFDNEIWK